MTPAEDINTWWVRGNKKEARRTSPQPKSKRGSWNVPTQFKTLLPQKIVGQQRAGMTHGQ